uniref:Uncharacterized protein n=1 Tax=Siphoviridae sp. ctL0q1 TaxID=2825449 RepID=A0A8S5PIY8_9CAUD|nr:MAG TPA: hypothetical protein [Siphoviridae sp. ctL0q1]
MLRRYTYDSPSLKVTGKPDIESGTGAPFFNLARIFYLQVLTCPDVFLSSEDFFSPPLLLTL